MSTRLKAADRGISPSAMSWSTFRRRRSRRSRTASWSAATPPWSAGRRGRRRSQQQDHRDQLQSLLDGAGVDRAPGPDSDHAEGPGLPDRGAHPHLRHAGQRAQSVADQLVLDRRGRTTASSRTPATSTRSARAHQLPQPRRRLYARHAGEEPVRRGHALRFLRLRAGAERARAGGLAAQGHARLGSPAHRRRRLHRATHRRQAEEAGAELHWVYITAWATPDGVVQFRDDIYNKDGLGQVADTVKG